LYSISVIVVYVELKKNDRKKNTTDIVSKSLFSPVTAHDYSDSVYSRIKLRLCVGR
jgi:hypothetical protein